MTILLFGESFGEEVCRGATSLLRLFFKATLAVVSGRGSLVVVEVFSAALTGLLTPLVVGGEAAVLRGD